MAAKSPRNRGERRLNIARLVSHLCVREAKRSETGRCVRLIPETVPRLLGGRAVVSQPVRLHDKAQLRPVEVDLEAVETRSGLRLWKACPAGDRQEASFQL